MCTTSSTSPPWSFFHFPLICLTAFSNHQRTFYGAQEVFVEVIMLILLVIPILFVQLKLGGMVQKSLYGLFHNYFPLFRGVAVTLVVQMFILQTYWSALPVHFICAGFASVTGEREFMTSCANAWNTDICRDNMNISSISPDYGIDYNSGISHGPGQNPIVEYFSNRFFQYAGTTLDDLGGFTSFPTFPLVLALTWIFIFLCVAFGPRVFAWVISVLGVLSTVIMIGVLGYGWDVVAESFGRDNGDALAYYYVPNYHKLGDVYAWVASTNLLMFTIPITYACILPTMGKFTGSGKVVRNISWLFVVLFAIILRHLPALTITPYQYAASDIHEVPMGNYMSKSLGVELVMRAFIDSNSHPSASFFYCLSVYLHYICGIALGLLVIVDNCLEIFDWLLNKPGCNKRIAWFITTAAVSFISFLLGLPFVTKGGLNLLAIVNAAVYMLSFVTRYLLGVGIIVIYIWQNIATAERIVIGIWTFFAFLVIVLLGIFDVITRRYTVYSRINYVPSDEENKRWWAISWAIAGVPLIFIPVFILLFIVQKMRSGNISIDQPTSNTTLKRNTDEGGRTADVVLISSQF